MTCIYNVGCVSQADFVADLLSHAGDNPVQSTSPFAFKTLPTNITANVNRTFPDLGSFVSTVIILWASAMTLGPSTARLKSGGREEVGVDPAGGQGDC